MIWYLMLATMVILPFVNFVGYIIGVKFGRNRFDLTDLVFFMVMSLIPVANVAITIFMACELFKEAGFNDKINNFLKGNK